MFDGSNVPWHARLALDFVRRGGRTLCSARHTGPLRLQKALHPEGDAVCHAVMIHPPGGIAGGDSLAVAVGVERGAHALVTTPGAGKWYKSNGRAAFHRSTLAVNGVLEWLPQESIVFDAAQAHSAIDITLGEGASMIGWDIVALGRRAMGETFRDGSFAQSIRIVIDGRLIWHERCRLRGGDALLASPVGLAGHTVFGCLWAAGPGVAAFELDALREELGTAARAAPLTRLAPMLLVARTVALGTEAARQAFEAIWRALRPRLLARAATPPRIWAT